MKAEYTRKLFYKKFPYKATITTPETGFIRYAHRKDLERLFTCEKYEQWGGVKHGFTDPYASWTRVSYKEGRNKRIWGNRFVLYKLYCWVVENRSQYPDDISIRNEGNEFTIFTLHKEIWDDFIKTFDKEIAQITWPKTDQHKKYLLENPTNIICNTLPFGKYRYKINLKSRIRDNNIQGMREWIENYKGEVHAAESLLKSLEEGYVYLENRGIYTNDESMITLIQMFIGDNIRNVTQYITDDELDALTDK